MRDDVRATHAIRLGLREIKGLSEEDAKLIVERRGVNYNSVRDVWLRTGLPPRVLERLADADAFASLGLTRREALWAAKALGRVGDRDDDLPLFASMAQATRRRASCRANPTWRCPPCRWARKSSTTTASCACRCARIRRNSCAPISTARGILRNEALRGIANNTRVKISGLVTCRQRPGSAKGVVFMTIEDESAVANVIVWPKVFERVRPVVLGARYVAVAGRVQAESGVIHVVADELEDLTMLAGAARRPGRRHRQPDARRRGAPPGRGSARGAQCSAAATGCCG